MEIYRFSKSWFFGLIILSLMLNFYGLLYGIVLIDYALETQKQNILKQGWNTETPVKYNNMKSYDLCCKDYYFLILYIIYM